MIYTDENYISQVLRKRASDAHKGDFGKILIFAGSPGMAGAAVLCGRAALRTGSGLVQFLLPQLSCEIYPILQTAVPEATCVPYTKEFDFNAYDAITCGSGIGQGQLSQDILKDILDCFGYRNEKTGEEKKRSRTDAGSGKTMPEAIPDAAAKTLVLDADALNLISKDPALAQLVRISPVSVIITPHVGEAKRLLDPCFGITNLADRKNAVLDLAEQYRCIAVLKGAGTLIADRPQKTSRSMPPEAQPLKPLSGTAACPQIFENTTGNPGMATAGSGDTLSGMIASLAGQGYAPLDAARIGVFLHGKAGDIAAEKLGEMSVTAGDIGENIPYALKDYYTAAL